MKKKTLVLVLTLALVLAIGAVGTLAWLTDTTTAIENTFTIGSLDISLAEPAWDDAETHKLYPSAVLDKDPTVTVAANSEACYVFVKVDVDTDLAAIAAINYDPTNWTLVTGETNVYYATVAASDTATVLEPVFTTVTVASTADNAAIAAAADDKIVVTAYAIQQAGFADAATAWGEF